MIKSLISYFQKIIWPEDLESTITIEVDIQKKYGFVFGLYLYKNPIVKNIVWQIKYRGHKKLAGKYGSLISDSIYRMILGVDSDTTIVLIPVPIHFRRRLERGFNQSEWLCEAAFKDLQSRLKNKTDTKIFYKNILRRKTYSKKQSWNGRQDRFKNTENVFAMHERNWKRLLKEIPLSEKTLFIIIDDVVTTGATLKETRRVLLEAGAVSVIAFTIGY